VQSRQQTIQPIHHRRAAWLIWLALACLSSGCISGNYRYGLTRNGSADPLGSNSNALKISFGEPPAHLARMEKVVQFPRDTMRKLRGRPQLEPDAALEPDAVLETNADRETNAQLARRSEAVEHAQEYLLANGLDELYIDVRTYDPRAQWQRLRRNERVSPLFRYTGGSLNWLRYTLLPRTVFRSDHFDPFTNTLSLNSDNPARAIIESARVKEFQRERPIGPGAYATLQFVPLVPLIHETRAASDALSYSQHHLQGRLLDQLYPLAYARIGAAAVSETLSVFTLSPGTPFLVQPLLIGSGNLAGRSIGRWMSPAAPPSADQPTSPPPPHSPPTAAPAHVSK